MKKQLSILLLPVIACSAIIPLVTSCKVAPTPLDHLTYVSLEDPHNIAITGFQHKYRNETELNVQPTYKIKGVTYTVTQIGDYDVNDFADHSNFGFYHSHLKKIILPSTIKKITDFAFAEQRCPWTMSDLQSEDLRNNWVTDFDLSKCNDLQYIGAYAFHCDTVNQFKLPKNNQVLTSLGGHAFSGVRFYNDLDFRGFKNLTTIGEWQFYATENGKGGYGGKKILLPVNDNYRQDPDNFKYRMESNAFLWSDTDVIYFNTKKFPDVDTNSPGDYNWDLSNFSFALSDFKEIHVQRSADLEEWADGIEANAGEIKIPGIDPIAIYHVGKLIADLNDDGSQGNPTAIKINLGPDWMKDIPFDLAFKGVLEYILQLELPNGPWGDGLHLYNVTNNLIQVDQFINDVDPSDQSELMYAALATFLSSPEHEYNFLSNDNDPWIMKMIQCEIFCIWDRVFKYR